MVQGVAVSDIGIVLFVVVHTVIAGFFLSSKGETMIRTEIKTKSSIVRIHDEYCNAPSEGCISHLNQIVSNYYKRRNITEEAVAVQDKNIVPQ